MLKNKYFYVAAISWIAIVAFFFNLYFYEATASQVPVVIAIIGTALGWITVAVLKKLGLVDPRDEK